MLSSRPSSITDERAHPMARCRTTVLKETFAMVEGVVAGFASKAFSLWSYIPPTASHSRPIHDAAWSKSAVAEP